MVKKTKEQKMAIEDYKLALINEAYHRKHMEYYKEEATILEEYLGIKKTRVPK